MTTKIKNQSKKFAASILFTDESVAVDLLTFLENPFLNKKDNDVLSKIYHNFKETRGSPAIPIFYTFSLLSYWNLINKVRFNIPYDPKDHLPNLWIMALAQSGASKTLSISTINKLLPCFDGKPILQPTFRRPASGASIVQQFKEQNIQFWVEDEAAQWLKNVENVAHPLSEAKGYLLKAKNGEPINSHTKTEGSIDIENVNISLIWINTIESMKPVLSEMSMKDGLASRITTVVAEGFSEPKSNYFNIEHIINSGINEDFNKIFNQNITNNIYTFNKDAEVTYDSTIQYFRKHPFESMQGSDNWKQPFFDRYALEAHKYALFHHQIHSKKGTVIDAESMQFGLRVVAFNLKSFLRYLFLRDTKTQRAISKADEKHENQILQIKEFIKSQEGRNGFGLRSICRRYHLKKEDAILLINEIKKTDKNFKTAIKI